MRKGMVLVSTLLSLFLVGCGSDQREGLVTKAVELLDVTHSKVASIHKQIDEAVKKQGSGQLNLQDAIRAANELKEKGIELQQTAAMIRSLREPVSTDERNKLREQFQERIEGSMAKLDAETVVLNKKMAELEKMDLDSVSKAAVEDLSKKVKEAQGEFDKLARQPG